MNCLKDNQVLQREVENEHQQQEEDEEVSSYEDLYPEQSQMTAETCILDVGPFLQRIQNYLQEKTAIYNASLDWTLMIQDLADFNQDKLSELLDTEQTWKRVISYNEEYSLVIEFGRCMNCDQINYLLNNSCGHLCCTRCWESHLRSQYETKGNTKIFPFCLKEQCSHYMNYEIIAHLKQQSLALQRLYENILISKYCRINSRFKFCPNLSCGKVIDGSLCRDQNITCSCGVQLCLSCGKQSHFPLKCDDFQVWNGSRLLMKCFECQSILSKDGDNCSIECVCGHRLCWRCENIWSDFCIDQKCFNKIKFVESSAQIYQGKHLSFDYFEQTKHQVDKLTRSIERVKRICSDSQIQKLISISIIEIQAEILNKLKNFIIDAWEFVKRCHIYFFFERKGAWNLRKEMNIITEIVDQADHYLNNILNAEYMSKQEFSDLKKVFIYLVSEGNNKIKMIKEELKDQ